MTASNPKFSVAIIGGGIGGVTLALALSKYPDIRFDLYEAAGAFEEIGAGVGIFARSLYALEDLGLIDALETINTPSSLSANAWDYRKADLYPTGKQFARRFYPTDLKGSGNYHRAQLLTLLVSLLPEHVRNQCIHFKKRLVRYENDATNGQVTIHFADGSTATSSVLIGADGIKSPTRQGMLAERAVLETDDAEKARILKHALPRWSGMVAYRGLVSADEVAAISGEPHRCTKDRIMYCGRNAHLVVFPIAMGKKINVVAFVSKNVLPEHKAAAAASTLKDDERTWPQDKPWIEPVPQEEMLEAYDGFEEEAIALLKCIKSPSRWAIHELDPLPFYAHGNVAVLGDAAHATQPHAGQGANQSIEDAYTLALALGSSYATAQTIPKALKAYEQARLTRANEVIAHSSKAGKMHQFMKDPEYDALDRLKAYIEGDWNRWLFIGSPKEEAEAAINSVFNAD
ncbi:FAD/NAD(P)-binding domain-containing protein [Hymenopellis radicata]|nr:FAD/NAD(P)-binding domain-containing protein [Hymenopellis radicata]